MAAWTWVTKQTLKKEPAGSFLVILESMEQQSESHESQSFSQAINVEEQLGDMVDDRLARDHEYLDWTKQLASLPPDKIDEHRQLTSMREERRLHYEKSGRILLGLEDPIADSARSQKLAEAAIGIKNEDNDEAALQHLGMIDGDGRFAYPRGVFSSEVDRKWDKYIESVKAHEGAVKQAVDEHWGSEVLGNLDRIRSEAHDEFTRALMREMGLDDTTDNFISVRRLAAKMRDGALPNTGELQIARYKVDQMLDKAIKDTQERKAS